MAHWRRYARAWVTRAALALAVLSAPCAAEAQDAATTTFTVSATVLAACSVSATDMDFGDYTASDVADDTATSTISVTCTDGEDYTVALDAGNGIGATVAARSMTAGTDSLGYGLYTTAGHLSEWGDGSNATVTVTDTGDGTQQDHTVYGVIPTAQYVPADDYSDSILVTVSF